MHKKRNTLLGLGLLLTTSVSSAAVITTGSLDEFNEFIAGANEVQLDTFDNDISAAESITFDSGVVSTLGGENIENSISINLNSVSDGLFRGGVEGDGSTFAETLTLDFGADVVAVGFDGFLFEVGRGSASIDQGTSFFEINDVMGGREGFFGIFDFDTPFQSLQFSSLDTNVDSFNLDNLRFVFANDTDGDDVEDVPAPATIGLLLIALCGLRVLRSN